MNVNNILTDTEIKLTTTNNNYSNNVLLLSDVHSASCLSSTWKC